MNTYRTLQWDDSTNTLVLLDQRSLPHRIQYVICKDEQQTAEAIRKMVVRGAPAIGAAAAFGLALAAFRCNCQTTEEFLRHIENAAQQLTAARPTAVNLQWALKRIIRKVVEAEGTIEDLRRLVLDEARRIADEDVRINQQIGLNALKILPEEINFIHHCNTGALATVDYGTALGIIRTAHEHGRKVFVFVDETRPRLQGAKLTAWELQQLDIPFKVIVDGASGFVMKRFRIDAVVVGCDRVAANGDTANKIGTYNLALAAKAHGVPFYVACPTSTIDLSIANGDLIPIEERDSEEITHLEGKAICPRGTDVFNPAFDVTVAELITAIITENGVCYPPFERSLRGVVHP
ncbi:MAG: S-methyl-5-thioribose-1-phosphate isomerase [Chloroflexota bacterium]